MSAQFDEKVLFVLELQNISGSLARWAENLLNMGDQVEDLRNLLREAASAVSQEE